MQSTLKKRVPLARFCIVLVSSTRVLRTLGPLATAHHDARWSTHWTNERASDKSKCDDKEGRTSGELGHDGLGRDDGGANIAKEEEAAGGDGPLEIRELSLRLCVQQVADDPELACVCVCVSHMSAYAAMKHVVVGEKSYSGHWSTIESIRWRNFVQMAESSTTCCWTTSSANSQRKESIFWCKQRNEK
jgi:hypothetical protein